MRPSALVVWPGLFLSLVWALPPQPGRTELCSYHSGNKPFFRLPAHNNHGQGGRSANKADFVDCRGVALLEPFHSSAYSRPQHRSRCRRVPLPRPGAVVSIPWLWVVPLPLLALVPAGLPPVWEVAQRL